MKEKDISELVSRYEQMLLSGRSIYFDAEEFDNLAEYYDLIDDIDESKKLVDIGLAIHPENYYLKLRKAKFMIYGGKHNKALEYLNNCFNGYEPELYLLKIECLLKSGLPVEASSLASELLQDEENDMEAVLSELGFLYADADYLDESIMYFQQSLAYNPDDIEVLSELGYVYEMKNDFASSISINNKILDIDPYSYETWINIGKLYSLQEEYENAIDAFDFAQTINDTDKDLLKLKAHCLSLCNREEEAIEMFCECLERDKEDESVYYAISECYFSLEQYDKMLEYLDKYESLKGETAHICAKKAIAYLQKGDIEKATDLIEKGKTIDPDNDDLNMVTGEMYFQAKNLEKAEEYFLKVYANNKNNATLLDKLSIICILKNNITKAIEYVESLVRLDSSSKIKIRLSLLYFESGNKEKFNRYLDNFNNEELKSLAILFFDEEQLNFETIDRQTLINRLNDARECRLLFKNIIY